MNEKDTWKGNDTYRYIRDNPGCTVYDIVDMLEIKDTYERMLWIKKLKQQTYTLYRNSKIDRYIEEDGLSHFVITDTDP